MLLTTMLAVASLCGGPTTSPAPDTSAATAEGIEVLRRILVENLDNAFAPKDTRDTHNKADDDKPDQGNGFAYRSLFENNALVTTLWSGNQTVSSSRGFHAPGLGVFFALDAALPVVVQEQKGASGHGGEPNKDDEWESMRRQVRSSDEGPLVLRSREVTDMRDAQIDPQAIDQTVDAVLKTLARHASRIEGLAANDQITVALHISGRNRMFLGDAGDGLHRSFSYSLNGDSDKGETKPFETLVLAGGTGAVEKNLVIRVALADLVAGADGNLDRLRQRAQINRY